jgi:hypothetical protein
MEPAAGSGDAFSLNAIRQEMAGIKNYVKSSKLNDKSFTDGLNRKINTCIEMVNSNTELKSSVKTQLIKDLTNLPKNLKEKSIDDLFKGLLIKHLPPPSPRPSILTSPIAAKSEDSPKSEKTPRAKTLRAKALEELEAYKREYKGHPDDLISDPKYMELQAKVVTASPIHLTPPPRRERGGSAPAALTTSREKPDQPSPTESQSPVINPRITITPPETPQKKEKPLEQQIHDLETEIGKYRRKRTQLISLGKPDLDKDDKEKLGKLERDLKNLRHPIPSRLHSHGVRPKTPPEKPGG